MTRRRMEEMMVDSSQKVKYLNSMKCTLDKGIWKTKDGKTIAGKMEVLALDINKLKKIVEG